MVKSCFIFDNLGVFVTEKVYDIIGIMDSRGSN